MHGSMDDGYKLFESNNSGYITLKYKNIWDIIDVFL